MIQYNDRIMSAIAFGAQAHGKTLDDGGNNYFLAHCLKVGEALMVLTHNEDVIIAGILHDTIEDTETTYDDISKEFGITVANLVKEVTHVGNKKEGYSFPNLKTPEGVLIKLIDRGSNISRMDCWNKKRQQRYIKKTCFWNK
jgi:(p)ppGpp synthase/HD superfamily hydrolase